MTALEYIAFLIELREEEGELATRAELLELIDLAANHYGPQGEESEEVLRVWRQWAETWGYLAEPRVMCPECDTKMTYRHIKREHAVWDCPSCGTTMTEDV